MIKHMFVIFFISALACQSCFMKRCRGRNCGVQMEHYHNGYEYRGTSLWKYIRNKNPRHGYWYPDLVKDPAAEPPHKK